MTGLLVLAASYAGGAAAASGTLGSGALGIDNFTLNSNIGSNPNAAGRGPGSLAYTLSKIFFGGVELYFDTNGVLVDPSGKPFSGTTLTGEVFKDGKLL
ncbi:hypothetical protein CJD38_10925 [Stenotrophobium rhamnosiphilum]|uniref:PEP-CTERM sorting domain-containing protein n=2 Tax=Stenotrophobium rhamnosiphilum TaxID=2029166 RepID=A0A2T5ME46_9GAMM|nr:hypothetical protein CJD38_10925 [Stenotrophobium rhamnosiphilum]